MGSLAFEAECSLAVPAAERRAAKKGKQGDYSIACLELYEESRSKRTSTRQQLDSSRLSFNCEGKMLCLPQLNDSPLGSLLSTRSTRWSPQHSHCPLSAIDWSVVRPVPGPAIALAYGFFPSDVFSPFLEIEPLRRVSRDSVKYRGENLCVP